MQVGLASSQGERNYGPAGKTPSRILPRQTDSRSLTDSCPGRHVMKNGTETTLTPRAKVRGRGNQFKKNLVCMGRRQGNWGPGLIKKTGVKDGYLNHPIRSSPTIRQKQRERKRKVQRQKKRTEFGDVKSIGNVRKHKKSFAGKIDCRRTGEGGTKR